VVRLSKGTPVVLLMYFSWSSGASNFPHTLHFAILKCFPHIIRSSPRSSIIMCPVGQT